MNYGSQATPPVLTERPESCECTTARASRSTFSSVRRSSCTCWSSSTAASSPSPSVRGRRGAAVGLGAGELHLARLVQRVDDHADQDVQQQERRHQHERDVVDERPLRDLEALVDHVRQALQREQHEQGEHRVADVAPVLGELVAERQPADHAVDEQHQDRPARPGWPGRAGCGPPPPPAAAARAGSAPRAAPAPAGPAAAAPSCCRRSGASATATTTKSNTFQPSRKKSCGRDPWAAIRMAELDHEHGQEDALSASSRPPTSSTIES